LEVIYRRPRRIRFWEPNRTR